MIKTSCTLFINQAPFLNIRTPYPITGKHEKERNKEIKKENMKYLKGEKKERKKEKKKERKILSMFHLQRSRTFESKPFKLK